MALMVKMVGTARMDTLEKTENLANLDLMGNPEKTENLAKAITPHQYTTAHQLNIKFVGHFSYLS